MITEAVDNLWLMWTTRLSGLLSRRFLSAGGDRLEGAIVPSPPCRVHGAAGGPASRSHRLGHR
jgi:hypothetical protein